MNKLEIYLEKYNNQKINKDEFYDYKKFDYIDESIFNYHLTFLLENCYNIKIIDNSRYRLNQSEFRKQLLQKFNNKCIVTGENCIDELEACHIIPINENESYNLNNGIILISNLHKTFDKYLWSINPETFTIEIKNNVNVGNIKHYMGQKINIVLNNELINNMKYHYNKFIIKTK